MMTSQEDEFQRSEVGNQDIGNHTESHDESRLGAEFFEGHAHDGFVICVGVQTLKVR